MAKNYDDFVHAMHRATENGKTIEKLVLSDESREVFLTDGDFHESTEEKHDDLGEYEVPIESGDGDYIITDDGETFNL